MDNEPFKWACKGAVSNKFIDDWPSELNDTQKYPLLRTYKQIKTEFTMEPYLDLVQSYRYRKAISSIKNSSHTLAVEYGRHHNIPQNMRLCHTCYIVEDEMHFITICKINQIERGILVSSRKESQCGYTPLSACVIHVTTVRTRSSKTVA